jgi:hypothetical protein
MHDEIIAKIANKYEIDLMSSMLEAYVDHGLLLSSRKTPSSVWLYIDLAHFTCSSARTYTHGSRHRISHAKPETTLTELTDSAWYVVITEPSLSD